MPFEPHAVEKANPTAIISGTSIDALPLSDASIPYKHCTLVARKPGANILTKSGTNAGIVWLCTGLEDISGAIPLSPGDSIDLPINCDLKDFFLAVDTVADGIVGQYVT